MIYMAGAYLIIWAASFVFILSMLRRQSKLEAELKALQELSQEKGLGGKA
jgi:CcmD family protein